MTNKNSKFNLMTGIALAAILVLTLAIPAFAANTDHAYPATEAAITKLLQTPYGTELPEMKFEFVVSQVAEDGKAPTANMPDVGTVTINFDGHDAAVRKEALDPAVNGFATGTDVWYLESGNIFAGKNWPHAGVYEYHIKETAATNPESASEPKEVYTYSEAEYTVLVYVSNSGGQLVITHIGVLMTTDDAGDVIDPANQVKVDPTPGGDGDNYIYSQLIFTNIYVKTNDGTDPEDPDDWTLSIGKEVTGDYSDPDIYFDFDLTIHAPALVVNPPAYNAHIVEYDPVSGGYSVVGSPIAFNSGDPESFRLKHNQFLVFLNTPVGTSYEVSEEGTTGYTPKVVVTYADAPGAEEVGKKDEGIALPATANLVYKNTLYVGEGINSAAFLNDRGTNAATGVSLDNLPFLVLIGAGMMALAGYVVFKTRRKEDHHA